MHERCTPINVSSKECGRSLRCVFELRQSFVWNASHLLPLPQRVCEEQEDDLEKKAAKKENPTKNWKNVIYSNSIH